MTRWYARPVLGVADVERALAFYTEKLGFAEAWRHAEAGKLLVAQVDRQGCELILSGQWPERVGRGLIFVSLDPAELDAARTAFAANGVGIAEGHWGYRLMIVADPDGNQLYFPYPGED
jgi:catechol 2,3-dioxygenase-like lactoylglutathione lyase family enzyme